ncbi:MAG: biopolymer transporter ExbD [Desulfuromonadales bacterium]
MLRFSPPARSRITIPLTALIDIVFLLLIYFLLASNFVTQEGIGIDLPKVKSVGLSSPRLTVVTVDKEGRFFFDKAMVDDRLLLDTLRTRLRLSSDRDVIIRADRKVLYDRVIKAMDIARQAGGEKLHLAIERE